MKVGMKGLGIWLPAHDNWKGALTKPVHSSAWFACRVMGPYKRQNTSHDVCIILSVILKSSLLFFNGISFDPIHLLSCLSYSLSTTMSDNPKCMDILSLVFHCSVFHLHSDLSHSKQTNEHLWRCESHRGSPICELSASAGLLGTTSQRSFLGLTKHWSTPWVLCVSQGWCRPPHWLNHLWVSNVWLWEFNSSTVWTPASSQRFRLFCSAIEEELRQTPSSEMLGTKPPSGTLFGIMSYVEGNLAATVTLEKLFNAFLCGKVNYPK